VESKAVISERSFKRNLVATELECTYQMYSFPAKPFRVQMTLRLHRRKRDDESPKFSVTLATTFSDHEF
jgi:hypothetical protein